MNPDDYSIIVPHHWTSEEALAVVRFLDEVSRAIWNLHGDAMLAILNRSNHPCHCSPESSQHFNTRYDPNDDLPF